MTETIHIQVDEDKIDTVLKKKMEQYIATTAAAFKLQTHGTMNIADVLHAAGIMVQSESAMAREELANIQEGLVNSIEELAKAQHRIANALEGLAISHDEIAICEHERNHSLANAFGRK